MRQGISSGRERVEAVAVGGPQRSVASVRGGRLAAPAR